MLPLMIHGATRAAGRRTLAYSCSARSDCRTGWITGRRNCRAANSSVSRWRARWPTGPRWCSPTSLRAISTRRPRTWCWSNSCGLVREEGTAAVIATHNERLAARMDRVVQAARGRAGLRRSRVAPTSVRAERSRSTCSKRDARNTSFDCAQDERFGRAVRFTAASTTSSATLRSVLITATRDSGGGGQGAGGRRVQPRTSGGVRRRRGFATGVDAAAACHLNLWQRRCRPSAHRASPPPSRRPAVARNSTRAKP